MGLGKNGVTVTGVIEMGGCICHYIDYANFMFFCGVG